jgi:putative phosphoesterase
MIAGFLSDAHGNAHGVERCLKALELEGAEQLYFLGDSVGYMPFDMEVLELLWGVGAVCIRGNHEEMLLGSIVVPESRELVYHLNSARSRVLPRWKDWLESWPVRLDVVLGGKRLMLVHGSPRDPIEEYVYPDTDLSSFPEYPCDFLLLGHTHRPFVRHSGSVTWINVGSCGLPRDVGGLASCAVLDTASGAVEILRIRLDADMLLRTLAGSVHSSVADCLTRVTTEPTVGRILDA